MLPVIGALVEGEGPEDDFSRAARDFFGMSCVFEKLCPTPKILYVNRRATVVTSRLSLRVFLGNLHNRGLCKHRGQGPKNKLTKNLYHEKLFN